MLFFSVLQLLILIAILILVILIYRNTKISSESFCNCVGMQYDGTAVEENPESPICSNDSTPRFRTGGCVTCSSNQSRPRLSEETDIAGV